MLVETDSRADRTIPVITVVLDNRNTTQLKKFKCSICGGTVFAYYDTIHMLLPVDIDATHGYSNEEEFYEPSNSNALTEVECTHFLKDSSGRRKRCRALYILNRG